MFYLAHLDGVEHEATWRKVSDEETGNNWV